MLIDWFVVIVMLFVLVAVWIADRDGPDDGGDGWI